MWWAPAGVSQGSRSLTPRSEDQVGAVQTSPGGAGGEGVSGAEEGSAADTWPAYPGELCRDAPTQPCTPLRESTGPR